MKQIDISEILLSPYKNRYNNYNYYYDDIYYKQPTISSEETKIPIKFKKIQNILKKYFLQVGVLANLQILFVPDLSSILDKIDYKLNKIKYLEEMIHQSYGYLNIEKTYTGVPGIIIKYCSGFNIGEFIYIITEDITKKEFIIKRNKFGSRKLSDKLIDHIIISTETEYLARRLEHSKNYKKYISWDKVSEDVTIKIVDNLKTMTELDTVELGDFMKFDKKSSQSVLLQLGQSVVLDLLSGDNRFFLY